MLLEENKRISQHIDIMAQDLDIILAGKRVVKAPNRSSVVVRNQFSASEGGVYSFQPHLDVNLHLPNLEERLKLRFTSYDEIDESRGVNRNRVRTTPRNRNIGAGVFIRQLLGSFVVEYQPRLEFPGQFQLSQYLKFATTSSNSFVSFNPEIQLYARADRGVGEFMALNTDWPIYNSLVFTFVNEEQYQDRDNLLTTNHGGILGWDYNDLMSQNISLIFESRSRPHFNLDRYTLAFGFFHRLYKNVVHYTVVPYLAFPRALDFRGSPGINFELNVIF